MHTHTRRNTDTKISHFNYFSTFICWKKFPNIRTLQEKKSSKGFHVEFLGAALRVHYDHVAKMGNGLESEREDMRAYGEDRTRQRGRTVFVETWRAELLLGRTKKAARTDAGNCCSMFWWEETRQRASTPFHNLVPQQLSQGTKRGRGRWWTSMFWWRRRLLPRMRWEGGGGQLSAAAAVTGYSGLSLNDGSPPQCWIAGRRKRSCTARCRERRRSVRRTESFRQRQARTCTAANQSLVAAERGRLT